jgi:mono/diheme cytochrome c family protein
VADQSAEWNRGAYLAEALGHCGECHTGRTFLQALDNRNKFAGGMAEGWRAYNLTSDKESGIGHVERRGNGDVSEDRSLGGQGLGVRADGAGRAPQLPEAHAV